MNPLKELLTALGFLTRLAPARLVDHDSISACMRWLPAVGLALGLIIVLPFCGWACSKAGPWCRPGWRSA
jgi:adenosylcobinamide-GDP ribazoletransferase